MPLNVPAFSFPVKNAQSETLIAQIPVVPVSVSVTSQGYDPYCGAYRATVQTPNNTYSVCYYKEQSTEEMSGSYTLYMYDQENGTWLYFTNGYDKWYTANQPVMM
ncbi:hypothetical protein [Stanieria cyanosphaera]|nr:hypothetical protein [Stanieria cyanosphaera]